MYDFVLSLPSPSCGTELHRKKLCLPRLRRCYVVLLSIGVRGEASQNSLARKRNQGSERSPWHDIETSGIMYTFRQNNISYLLGP